MTLWHIALFAAGSLLALRSFVTLTQHHQRTTLQKLLRDQQEATAHASAPASQKAAA